MLMYNDLSIDEVIGHEQKSDQIYSYNRNDH